MGRRQAHRLLGLSVVVLFAADGALVADREIDGPLPDPFVAGAVPPPATYDCRSRSVRRVSPIPLRCVVDASCPGPLVVAHRGAGTSAVELPLGLKLRLGRFAPENTLSAIRWAIAVGADMVELDVQTSRDGQLVLIHDADVSRTTHGRGRVADLSLAELRGLRLRTRQFRGEFDCARIPTLAEALELARGQINVYLDVKAADAALVARVVQHSGAMEQAFLSSGDPVWLAAAREAVPGIQVLPRVGQDPALIAPLLAAFHPRVVELGERLLRPQWMSLVRRHGAKVLVDGFNSDVLGYLTNEPGAYASLIARGADLLQIDRPDLLLRLLQRGGSR